MKKKGLKLASVLLTFIMVTAAAGIPAAQALSVNEEVPVKITNDFENSRDLDDTVDWSEKDSILYLDDGWVMSLNQTAYSGEIFDDPEDIDNRALRLTRTALASDLAAATTYSKTINTDVNELNGIVDVSFRFYRIAAGNALFFNIRGNNGTTTPTIVNASIAPNGTMYESTTSSSWANAAVLVPNTGEWYDITFRIDFTQNRKSVSINGGDFKLCGNNSPTSSRIDTAVAVSTPVTGLAVGAVSVNIHRQMGTGACEYLVDDITAETTYARQRAPITGDYPAWQSFHSEPISAVTQNLTLPATYTKGEDTYDIAWSSNTPDVLSSAGIVNRDILGLDQNVALTASFSGDGPSLEDHIYNVRVLAPGGNFTHMDFENSRTLDETVDWNAKDSILSLNDGWERSSNQTAYSTAIGVDPKDCYNRVLSVSRTALASDLTIATSYRKTINTNVDKLNGVVYVSFRINRIADGQSINLSIIGDNGTTTPTIINASILPDGRVWESTGSTGRYGGDSYYAFANKEQWYDVTFLIDFTLNRKSLSVDGEEFKLVSGSNSASRIDSNVPAGDPVTGLAVGAVSINIPRQAGTGAAEYLIDDITVREQAEYPYAIGGEGVTLSPSKIYRVANPAADSAPKAIAALYAPGGNELEWVGVTDLSAGLNLFGSKDLDVAGFPAVIPGTGYTVKIFGWDMNALKPVMKMYEGEY